MKLNGRHSVIHFKAFMFPLARCIVVFAAFAFAQPPAQEKQQLSRQRDMDVLRDMPPVAIGGGLVDSTLDEATYRKSVYDTLTEYNIPVKWTPKPTPSTEPPTIFVVSDPLRDKDVVSIVMTLQIVDKVVLTRGKSNRTILAVVWDKVDGGYFPPAHEKEETQKIVKRLIEKFCLSYLAANRR